MRTGVEAVSILPDGEVQTPNYARYPKKTIRNDDGQFMLNRLIQLINDYGDRVVVPKRLVLELLREHKKKSRILKQKDATIKEATEDRDEALAALFLLTREVKTAIDSVLDYAKSHNDTGELSGAVENIQKKIDLASAVLAQYKFVEVVEK